MFASRTEGASRLLVKFEHGEESFGIRWEITRPSMYANEALHALEGVTGLSRILAVEAHLTLGQFEKARDEADAL